MDGNAVMKDARRYVKDAGYLDYRHCSGSSGAPLMAFFTAAVSATPSGISPDRLKTPAEGPAILQEEGIENLKSNPGYME